MGYLGIPWDPDKFCKSLIFLKDFISKAEGKTGSGHENLLNLGKIGYVMSKNVARPIQSLSKLSQNDGEPFNFA